MLITKPEIEENAFKKLILTGKVIVNKFEITRADIESTAISLAQIASMFKNDDKYNKEQVRRLLDKHNIDGGGVWPLPYALSPDKEKDSIFFTRGIDNVLRYDEGYNLPDTKPYIKEAWFVPLKLFPINTPLWSKSYIDPITNIPLITVSVPIIKNDNFFGVCTIDIDIGHIATKLQQIAYSMKGYAFLLDRDDTLFSFSKSGAIINKKFSETIKKFPELKPALESVNSIQTSIKSQNEILTTTILRKIPDINRSQANEISEMLHASRQRDRDKVYDKTFIIEHDPFFNAKSFGLIYTVPSTHWKLGLVIPFNIAFSKAITILLQLISISFAVSIIITFLGYLIMKYLIINPITNISRQLKDENENEISNLKPITTNQRGEIGDMVSIFNERTVALQERERAKDIFGKYIDSRVLENILKGDDNLKVINGNKNNMTVLFSDIEKFTTISQQLTPAGLISLLNRYFTLVSEPIAHYKGVIDKYIGDAVMAFWGAPFTGNENHAVLCCMAALEEFTKVDELNEEISELLGIRKNIPVINIRIGICTGEVIAGPIGSDKSQSYTVIGDTVNLASRLESVNKLYGTRILINETTYKMLDEGFVTRLVDNIIVIGMVRASYIYELVGKKGMVEEEIITLIDLYEHAFSLYQKSEWNQAIKLLTQCLEINPQDTASKVLRERIEKYKLTPPAEDWNGIWKMEAK
jgi:adenylate cyclase